MKVVPTAPKGEHHVVVANVIATSLTIACSDINGATTSEVQMMITPTFYGMTEDVSVAGSNPNGLDDPNDMLNKLNEEQKQSLLLLQSVYGPVMAMHWDPDRDVGYHWTYSIGKLQLTGFFNEESGKRQVNWYPTRGKYSTGTIQDITEQSIQKFAQSMNMLSQVTFLKIYYSCLPNTEESQLNPTEDNFEKILAEGIAEIVPGKVKDILKGEWRPVIEGFFNPRIILKNKETNSMIFIPRNGDAKLYSNETGKANLIDPDFPKEFKEIKEEIVDKLTNPYQKDYDAVLKLIPRLKKSLFHRWEDQDDISTFTLKREIPECLKALGSSETIQVVVDKQSVTFKGSVIPTRGMAGVLGETIGSAKGPRRVRRVTPSFGSIGRFDRPISYKDKREEAKAGSPAEAFWTEFIKARPTLRPNA